MEWWNMRIRNKALTKAICRGAAWLALLLTLGCEHAAKRTVTPPPTTVMNTTVINKPVEPPPPSLVNVEQDAGGFTITQSVVVSDELRANYERAVRMLEQAQYEPGIALLLKVTEQAPTL